MFYFLDNILTIQYIKIQLTFVEILWSRSYFIFKETETRELKQLAQGHTIKRSMNYDKENRITSLHCSCKKKYRTLSGSLSCNTNSTKPCLM